MQKIWHGVERNCGKWIDQPKSLETKVCKDLYKRQTREVDVIFIAACGGIAVAAVVYFVLEILIGNFYRGGL